MEVVEAAKFAVPAQQGFSSHYDSSGQLSPNGVSVGRAVTGSRGVGAVVVCGPKDPPVSRMLVPGGGQGGALGTSGRSGGGGADDDGDRGPGAAGLTQRFIGGSGIGSPVAAATGTRPLQTAITPPAPASTTTTDITAGGRSGATNPDPDCYLRQQHTTGLGVVTTAPPPPSQIRVTMTSLTTATTAATTTPSPEVSPSVPTPPPLDNFGMDKKNNNNNNVDDDDGGGGAPPSSDTNDDEGNVNNNMSCGEEKMMKASSPGSVTTSTMATTTATTTGGGTGEAGGGPVRNLRARGQRKFLPEKTRHKRQTLQDMTRPLKQWLLRHRDNPYPSKAQKMDLVSKSQMTLTQVSNWFANARRRLKNTVKQPDLTWASRIKLYNSCVEGNAELFSIGSDDSCPESDDDMMEHRQSDTFHDDVTDSLTSSRTATPDVTGGGGEVCGNFNHGSSNSSSNSGRHSSNHSHASHHHSYHHHHSSNSSSSSSVPSSGNGAHPPYPGLEDTCVTFPKYKHSILHRYLSDAHQQALILDEDSVAKSRDRHHSSSTGSRDFEELSTSSVSSPAHESVHHDHLDDFSEEFETMALRRRTSDVSSSTGEEDMYWKEIGAALALTSLARGRIINT